MDFFKLTFSLVFAIAGTLFLSIAYREWRSNYSIITQGVETEGVVIETYRKTRRTGEMPSTAEAPVVEFSTETGERRKYYSTLFTTPCNYEQGVKVPIWYLPNDPNRATLNGKDAWILPVMFGIFGCALCLITYPILLQMLARRIWAKGAME